MFGINELKRDVKELIIDSINLKEANNRLQDNVWMLSNPPKYELGQKVKNVLITKREFVRNRIAYTTLGCIKFENAWKYITYDFESKEIKSMTENELSELIKAK